MANTPDYNWPPMDKRKIIGKPYKRLDGPQKASGRAKYCSDLKPKDMLFGVYLTSPHAHARVTSIDTSEAEKTAGVKAVHVVSPAGTEVPVGGDGDRGGGGHHRRDRPATPCARSRWSMKCCRTW